MVDPYIHLHVLPLKADSSHLMALNRKLMLLKPTQIIGCIFHEILRAINILFAIFRQQNKNKTLLITLNTGSFKLTSFSSSKAQLKQP